MFLINKKLRKLQTEISELELAIDEITIYDPHGYYKEKVIEEYQYKLLNKIKQEYDLKRQKEIRRVIFLYLILLSIFLVLELIK
jgi:hypothetical protein